MRRGIYEQIGRSRFLRGFTLLEVLVIVGVMSVVASIGYVAYSEVRENVREMKLINDVSVLNAAVIAYRASGGTLSTQTDAESVLFKLKQSPPERDQKTLVGATTGSLIDRRIVMVRAEKFGTSSSRLRAFWDKNAQMFKITSKPADGQIARFVLDEDSDKIPYGVDESRSSVYSYSEQTHWIWDYTEAAANSPLGPTVIPVGNPVNSNPPGTPVSPGNPPASDPPPAAPPGSTGSSAGGIALNLGAGSTTAKGGLAVNLLSDEVSSNSGQLSVGVLNVHLTLGGGADGSVNTGTMRTNTGYIAPIKEGADGIAMNLGDGAADADQGLAANLGEGAATAVDGVAANAGSGESSTVSGIAANVGKGDATSVEGLAGNVGTGSSSATNGVGINLGSGLASAGE